MFQQHDNFLSDKAFAGLRLAAKAATFSDVTSGVDGVTYPSISEDVPWAVRTEIEDYFGKKAWQMFMRRSPEGVHCPNIHHTDNSMGKTSLMLYLDEPRPGAGTSFVRHIITGIAYASHMDVLVGICKEDSNKLEAWVPYMMCAAQPNRACIFDSGYFHRAEPIGGYGDGDTSRTVLTAFFD